MSDLPRLLLCSFDVLPGPSGSSRRLTEYLKALPDRFSVVVLSAKTPDHSHIEKYQGARLLRVPVGTGDLASRIQTFERAVKRQLDSEEYALAHFMDPFGGYVLCEMKGDYGYRLIYEAQTFPSQDLRYTHPQLEGDKRFLARIRRQELFCLMNADLVITGSMTTRSYIQSLGASTEQVRVIRAPVDLGPYTPDVLGVPDGEPMRLMYLGSQSGWQGLHTLLRAVGMVVAQDVNVKLTVVGPRNAEWQPHLEELAKELGIQDHVEFQPAVVHDDLFKVLALADVGVLPLDDVDRNRLQGGPLAKTSEYLAAGRPVLAADLPVTRELLPESAVLFHPAGDVEALAAQIVELARDVPRRLAMGREARAFAEQELDASLIRGKLLDIYEELLGKRTAVGAPEELPVPTMTGTPTNRLSQMKPPEGGKRSSRKSSEGGKAGSKKAPPREDLPVVPGQALASEGTDSTLLIKTELESRPSDPPVVMGLPLRDKEPSPPRRREEPEEPPTSIVRPVPSSDREDAPPAPTPIVRSPMKTVSEAPSASSARAPAPLSDEEPPAPTPIVPLKQVGGGRAGSASKSSLAAPGASTESRGALKESASTASPSTSTRGALKESVPPTSASASPRGAPQEPAPVPAASTTARAASPEAARGQEPQEKARQSSLPPLVRSGPPAVEPRGPPPRLSPVETPSIRTPPPLPVVVAKDEPEEISEEEAQEIPDEAALDAVPTPPHPRPRAEEPEELSDDDVKEADAAGAIEASDADDQVENADDVAEPVGDDDPIENADDTMEAPDDAVQAVEDEPPAIVTEAVVVPVVQPAHMPVPLSSALDPWFAQLAHGYCPPEGAQFARHTPPTNFPGRDEDPTDSSKIPTSPRGPGGLAR